MLYDLLASIAFYPASIDVGIEILPMKSLQQMSSGVAYYEGELYNVVRQGRGVPAATGNYWHSTLNKSEKNPCSRSRALGDFSLPP